MSRGMPSMTALLGLLAVAGYQNRDKIKEMLGGLTQSPSGVPRSGSQGSQGGPLGNLGGLLGGASVGSVLSGGLRDLIERFPSHPLADDAAWQLTLLPPAGECEGFVICYVESRWRMVRDFLGAYPASPYAPRALDRAIAAFDDNLRPVADLSRSSEFYDAGDLPPLLAEFDSVTTGLPKPLRERAAAYSSGLRRRLTRR